MFDDNADPEYPIPNIQESEGWTFDTLAAIMSPIEDFYLMIRGLWEGSQRGDPLCARGATFVVALCTEWSYGNLTHLLEEYGISMYNYGIAGDRQMFMVDQWNEAKTDWVLRAYGVPIAGPGEEIQWKT